MTKPQLTNNDKASIIRIIIPTKSFKLQTKAFAWEWRIPAGEIMYLSHSLIYAVLSWVSVTSHVKAARSSLTRLDESSLSFSYTQTTLPCELKQDLKHETKEKGFSSSRAPSDSPKPFPFQNKKLLFMT